MTEPAGPADAFGGKSASHHMVRGTAWMVAMRFGVHGIGFFSTLILARLLTPEDFGLLAMALMVVLFMYTFTETGLRLAVIRHPGPDRSHYDTAFTVVLGIGVLLGGLLYALAPVMAHWFGDDRVTELLRLLCLVPPIMTAASIRIIDFQRDLTFGRDFTYQVTAKALGFVLTIGLALWLRNYWALAWGFIGSQLIQTLISYWFAPYRPRFTLSRLSELWGYSSWVMVQSLSRSALSLADRFVLGRALSAGAFGYYNMMADFSKVVLGEIILSAQRALFPVFSKLTDDKDARSTSFQQVLVASAFCALPLGVGLSLTAETFVSVVYGEQWAPAAPLLTWLALAMVADVLSMNGYTVLNALGASGRAGALVLARLVATVAMVAVLAFNGGASAVAQGLLVVNGAALVLSYWVAGRLVGVGALQLIRLHARPALAAAMMAAALVALAESGVLSAVPSALALLLQIGVGGGVFLAAAFVLWLIARRPDGPEAAVFGRVLRLTARD
ncbi:MAG: lipopolysaccharide biosynthesis protein [Pseudomonadota bacterium]